MAPKKKADKKFTPKRKFEYRSVTTGISSVVPDELDNLGLEGWELVQTTKDKTSRTFIFKREL